MKSGISTQRKKIIKCQVRSRCGAKCRYGTHGKAQALTKMRNSNLIATVVSFYNSSYGVHITIFLKVSRSRRLCRITALGSHYRTNKTKKIVMLYRKRR